MKKLRPFLALLLAAPALADGETGGDTSESLPVSDSASDNSPSFSEEAPSEDSPASEASPPESAGSPDTPDDTPSFPDDSPSAPEDPPPVVEEMPNTPDPVPVDPEPMEPESIGPTEPELPADPAGPPPENPVPEVPEDPLPENPAPEAPVDPAPVDPLPESPVVVPEVPVDPLPVYPIPDSPLVPGELYEVGTEEAPAAETHQVFTITTIPEFALALMDADADNTMSQVIRNLFGTYTPRVQTVTTYMGGEPIAIEEQYVPGVAGMDWEWIGGFAVFLLLIYCLFRLLGGAVKYG